MDGRVCKIVMENIHDIVSSFHFRLQALEGNLGVTAILDKDEDQRKFEYSKHSLERIAPYVCRHAHKAWYIMPDVRTNDIGRDPYLIGHGYKNGKRIEIEIRYNPNHDKFEVKFCDEHSSENALTITELLDKQCD